MWTTRLVPALLLLSAVTVAFAGSSSSSSSSSSASDMDVVSDSEKSLCHIRDWRVLTYDYMEIIKEYKTAFTAAFSVNPGAQYSACQFFSTMGLPEDLFEEFLYTDLQPFINIFKDLANTPDALQGCKDSFSFSSSSSSSSASRQHESGSDSSSSSEEHKPCHHKHSSSSSSSDDPRSSSSASHSSFLFKLKTSSKGSSSQSCSS